MYAMLMLCLHGLVQLFTAFICLPCFFRCQTARKADTETLGGEEEGQGHEKSYPKGGGACKRAAKCMKRPATEAHTYLTVASGTVTAGPHVLA